MGLKELIINGEMDTVEGIVKDELESGREPDSILKEMIEGMEEVGERFERKEYYVPETLLSAHTMKQGLEVLRPHLSMGATNSQGRVLIGAVESDIHDIGLNLVAMFLEAAGFEIHNLGRDVPTAVFLKKAEELDPNIVGLSAMMSTTMLRIRDILEEFESKGLKDGRYFVVGGAALSEELAKEIGADAYATDAKKAIQVFEKLMEDRQ